jgi:hypothetical protein
VCFQTNQGLNVYTRGLLMRRSDWPQPPRIFHKPVPDWLKPPRIFNERKSDWPKTREYSISLHLIGPQGLRLDALEVDDWKKWINAQMAEVYSRRPSFHWSGVQYIPIV